MAKSKSFIPTLNAIRTSRKGELDGFHVAEGFDSVNSVLGDINSRIAKLEQPVAATTTVVTTVNPPSKPAVKPSSNNTEFGAITTGENTAAIMTVGEGSQIMIDLNLPGVIESNSLWEFPISPQTPLDQQVLTFNASLGYWIPEDSQGGGGSTPPGGSSGDIQFNNGSGGFGGLSSFYLNPVNGQVVVIDTSSISTSLAGLTVQGNTQGDDIQDWYTSSGAIGSGPDACYIQFDGTFVAITGLRNIGTYLDAIDSPGTPGQVLTSTVTGTQWATGSGGGNYYLSWFYGQG